MKLVVTGGGGFIGSHLCKALHQKGYHVFSIGQNIPQHVVPGVTFVKANLMKGETHSVMQECDTIIHLAGAPIFRRWTKSYKELLFDSRIKTAESIYENLLKSKNKPKSFISASAVGFYGDRGEEILDEKSPAGHDFLASICVEWEKTSEMFRSLNMRTVCVRTAPTIGIDGGLLYKMLPLFKLGLGAKFGKGLQWFPWIHVDDLVKIYIQAIEDVRIQGPINAVAPQLIRNIDFTQTLATLLKKPASLSMPAWALRLIFSELSTLFLSSQKVIPQRLCDLGFSFNYPTIEKALRACFPKN